MNKYDSLHIQKTTDTVPGRKPEKSLQRVAVNNEPLAIVPPIVHESLRNAGRPLDAETQALMEPRFGHDFSNVRVHTDGRAAESAQAVNALAYTVGRDVVFDAGQYAPDTQIGKQLLAHELTHTLQQSRGQTSHPAGESAMCINEPGDHYEQEAHRTAQSVLAPAQQLLGNTNQASMVRSTDAPVVQRADPWTFSPLKQKPVSITDPTVIEAAANKVIANQAPVQQWLDTQRLTLRDMTMDQLITAVKNNVPQAAKLADAEIQNLIQQWASNNKIAIKQTERYSALDNIAKAAASAVSLLNDGIKITASPVETSISISGATAKITKGGVSFEANVGLTGKAELSAAYGNLKFAAEVSSQEWKLTLSYGPHEAPDLSSVTQTFQAGEKSILAIAKNPGSLKDPTTSKNAQEALSTLSKIVQAAGQRIEISIGSPSSVGTPSGMPKGAQVTAMFTIGRF